MAFALVEQRTDTLGAPWLEPFLAELDVPAAGSEFYQDTSGVIGD